MNFSEKSDFKKLSLLFASQSSTSTAVFAVEDFFPQLLMQDSLNDFC